MPLTAVHAEVGLLDATLPDLGGALAWEQVHRVRPPAPLTCRACSAPMAAKVSVRGMRFFAHRADASDCPTVGETIAHRLLKLELAAAIRDAGWHADLEVPGRGWRADVLAVSPDGARRIAFEAQLAAATVAELAERTNTMATDGVEVCWITDKDTTWVTHVPSARVCRPAPVREATDETPSARTPAEPLTVVDGHARFEPNWCTDRAKCARVQNYGQPAVPCPGHGSWFSADTLALSTFVRGVCGGQVRCISTTRPALMRESRHEGGTTVWTTQRHHRAEADQRVASEAHEKWATAQRAAYERQLERAAVEQARHHAYIEALLARQAALIRPTVDFVYHAAGVSPRVLDTERVPRFAMGVPVLVGERLWALICPVATRITPALAGWFATATIVVADDRERERIAKYTRPGQRFKVIDPGPLPAPQSPQRPGITIHQAVSRMFGGLG